MTEMKPNDNAFVPLVAAGKLSPREIRAVNVYNLLKPVFYFKFSIHQVMKTNTHPRYYDHDGLSTGSKILQKGQILNRVVYYLWKN